VSSNDLMTASTDALEACGGSSTVVARACLADALVDLVGAEGPVLIGPGLTGLGVELHVRGVDIRLGCSEHSSLTEPSTLAGARAAEFATVAPQAACAITGALLGIAASGTVAVGTRAGNAGLLSSLPPHHIVVLPRNSIERDLADALQVLVTQSAPWGPSFVLITGPSRTSDIEMRSVLGVHGPMKLDVVIVDEDSGRA
jgi:hypothetical protein